MNTANIMNQMMSEAEAPDFPARRRDSSSSSSSSSLAFGDPSCVGGCSSDGEIDTSTDNVLLPPDFRPSNLEVIAGRGMTAYNHGGNVAYRTVIDSYLDEYRDASSKLEKSLIVSKIVRIVYNREGRGEQKQQPQDGREATATDETDATIDTAITNGQGFVKLGSDGRWYRLSSHNAREKVGQTLREALIQADPAMRAEKRLKRAIRRAKRKEANPEKYSPSSSSGGKSKRKKRGSSGGVCCSTSNNNNNNNNNEGEDEKEPTPQQQLQHEPEPRQEVGSSREWACQDNSSTISPTVDTINPPASKKLKRTSYFCRASVEPCSASGKALLPQSSAITSVPASSHSSSSLPLPLPSSAFFSLDALTPNPDFGCARPVRDELHCPTPVPIGHEDYSSTGDIVVGLDDAEDLLRNLSDDDDDDLDGEEGASAGPLSSAVAAELSSAFYISPERNPLGESRVNPEHHSQQKHRVFVGSNHDCQSDGIAGRNDLTPTTSMNTSSDAWDLRLFGYEGLHPTPIAL